MQLIADWTISYVYTHILNGKRHASAGSVQKGMVKVMFDVKKM
jgi:hypothetical protein